MPVTCTNYKLKCGGCPLLGLDYAALKAEGVFD